MFLSKCEQTKVFLGVVLCNCHAFVTITQAQLCFEKKISQEGQPSKNIL